MMQKNIFGIVQTIISHNSGVSVSALAAHLHVPESMIIAILTKLGDIHEF